MRLLRLQAKASRTGENPSSCPKRTKPRASVSTILPPSRTGTLCSSHTAPSCMPTSNGSTFRVDPTVDQPRYMGTAVAQVKGDWRVRQRAGRAQHRISLNVGEALRHRGTHEAFSSLSIRMSVAAPSNASKGDQTGYAASEGTSISPSSRATSAANSWIARSFSHFGRPCRAGSNSASVIENLLEWAFKDSPVNGTTATVFRLMSDS